MRRSLPALLALLLVGPLLAGCGDDGGSSSESSGSSSGSQAGEGSGDEDEGDGVLDAVELIRQAPEAAEEAGSAAMEMTIEAGGVTIEAEGALDFAAQTGTMTMSLPAPAESDLEMVFEEDVIYMSAASLGPIAPGVDAEWVQIDPAELENLGGTSGLGGLAGGAGGGGATNNPANTLNGLEGISEDGLEEVGTEEVRGVETTHFEAEIDMEAALEQAEEQGVELDEEIREEFEASFGDEAVPVEVWVDEDGLTRRMVMSIPSPAGDVELELEMFDYGEPVEVEIPDPADTIGLGDLLGSFPGGPDTTTVPGDTTGDA